ncbi:hypothetical protein NEMIN01_2112 [Nematocida minor]|uniref:uncharacterized protein n=1 Tax=Nematocida minor TaxID=1912983 RepID=UPI00221EEE81|nr:uncharacterized protein NEMIN01_2112 [Nematocida minor]KAI5192613.1 hypothetical protein NEMIN01_2112 [Nematocida minor]
MKKQNLKKIPGASGVALIFFIMACRGSENPFNGNLNGSVHPYIGLNIAANAIPGAYSSFILPPYNPLLNALYLNNGLNSVAGQYLAGPGIYGAISNPIYNIPGSSIGQNMPLYNVSGINLSSVIQAPTDSLAYAGYSGQGFNPANPVGQQHIQPNPFIPGSSLLGYPFNPVHSMAGTSREVGRVDNAAISSAALHAHSISQNDSASLEKQQRTEEYSSPGENVSREKRSSIIMTVGKKRKIYETDSPIDTCDSWSALNSKKEKKRLEDVPGKTVSSAQQDERKKKNKEKPAIKYITPELEKEKKEDANRRRNQVWSDRRLTNKRRKGYRTKHQTVYKLGPYTRPYTQNAGEDSYQEKNKKAIESFSKDIAPELEQNALWYFIANTSTNISTKYQAILQLQEMFDDERAEKYKKIMMGFKGYYPGVFEDIIDYIDIHQPIRINRDTPPTVWKETLGDIYVREALQINHSMMKDQEKIEKLDEKYHPVAYAVYMILTLPEVYQDFSSITENFIRETQTSKNLSRNKKDQQVLVSIHKLAEMIAKKIDETEVDDSDGVYKEIYSALEEICAEKGLLKPTIVDLYREVYTIIGRFYESAEAANNEDMYVLVGKCMITNHKYMKCEITADIAPKDIKEKVLDLNYSLEVNRWSVLPDIKKHYHIHYVDNTAGKARMLCMPMHVDKGGNEHYLHTISDIVEYIKKLYDIENNLDIIHPFKVNRLSTKWTYIRKKDRTQTVKDLKGYEVVFYRIDENLGTAKFTFAEFRSSYSDNEYTICIPLFLTPLMRSAMELGPFSMLGEHKEIDSILLEDRLPDAYKYNKKYNIKKYSDVQNYYSNLCILVEKIKSVECYSMDCKVADNGGNIVEAVWYVRKISSVNEYTCCILDKSFKEKRHLKSFNDFIKTVESREHNQGCELEGLWISNNSEDSEPTDSMQKIYNWMVKTSNYSKYLTLYSIKEIELKLKKERQFFEKKEREQHRLGSKDENTSSLRERNKISAAKYKTKIKIEKLCKVLSIKLSKKPNTQTDFMVFRNRNGSKSNLGAHNEILDFLISCYNYTTLKPK